MLFEKIFDSKKDEKVFNLIWLLSNICLDKNGLKFFIQSTLFDKIFNSFDVEKDNSSFIRYGFRLISVISHGLYNFQEVIPSTKV